METDFNSPDFDPNKLKRGRVSRREFKLLPVLTEPEQIANYKRRFFKVNTPHGWLIGDIQKAEFLRPVFSH